MSARLLTPRGPGGVAVLVTDAASLARLDVSPPTDSAPHLVRLRAGDEALDEALLVRRGDSLELHLHGSPPLVARVLERLGGSTPSERDGHAARAAALVGAAPSELGARVLLDQAAGAFQRAVELEAPEVLRERGRQARFLLERTRVVLAGPVNAGKSTLFNALVGHERVTVSAESGTTRDAVRAEARLGPWPVELVDTAGERAVTGDDAPARVERAGQRQGRAVRDGADLELWLDPEGAAPAELPDAPHRVRLTSRASEAGLTRLRALEDPAAARDAVAAAFAGHFGLDPSDVWVAGRGVPFDGPSRALVSHDGHLP